MSHLMIKFHRLRDEEGCVEITQPLVEDSSNPKKVFCQSGRNWLYSLNQFQKMSLALMTFLLFLVLLLLLMTLIDSKGKPQNAVGGSHHRDSKQETTSIISGYVPPMITKQSSATTRMTSSQDLVTRITFSKSVSTSESNTISSNQTTKKPSDGILAKLSTSEDTSTTRMTGVGVRRGTSTLIYSTSSSEKGTTRVSNNTEMLPHSTSMGVSSSPEVTFKSTGISPMVSSSSSRATESTLLMASLKQITVFVDKTTNKCEHRSSDTSLSTP